MSNIHYYPAVIQGNDQTGYRSILVDFPSDTAYGDDMLEVITHSEEMLHHVLSEYVVSGRELPPPSIVDKNHTVISANMESVLFDHTFGVNGFKTLIFHHKDGDGYAAAAAFHAHGFSDATYYPVKYGTLPAHFPWDDLSRKKYNSVFVLDFSFNRDTTLMIKDHVESLIVLDHHTTAVKNLEGIHGCYFDLDGSGASMSLQYAVFLSVANARNDHGAIKKLLSAKDHADLKNIYSTGWNKWRSNDPVTFNYKPFEEAVKGYGLIELADDYDQFKFKHGVHTDAYNEMFALLDKNEDVVKQFSELIFLDIDQLIDEPLMQLGYTAVTIRDIKLKRMVKNKQYHVKKMRVFVEGQVRYYKAILTTMSGDNHYNHLAKMLREDDSVEDYDVFVNAFIVGNEHVVLNFRQGKGDVDVSKVAETLGGGGRKQTAGAVVQFFVYEGMFQSVD